MDRGDSSKKYIILALLIFIISAVSLYQLFLKNEPSSLYEGTIISLTKSDDGSSMLVDGSFMNNGQDEATEGVIRFTLTDSTIIQTDHAEAASEDLAVGNLVRIESSDTLRTSYPAQGDAEKVTILSEVSTEIIIKGEIMEVSTDDAAALTFLVQGEVTGYGAESEVYVRVPEHAYTSHDAEKLFSVGNRVFVVIDGPLAESYPMQGSASSVIQVDEN
ncbi:DUF3221 domain-containing protein, partial [Proteiniclasticum sp. C24MP]|uniref:DUF3221 domain-containing protein n=1 Tax=Proteiniclasticum sp. C24MP TaxID=3374101 RepID=UPI003754D5A3